MKDAFILPEKRWEALEERFSTALENARNADDIAAALLAALLSGMKPKQREAMALGVMVGRISVAGVEGGLRQ